MDLSVSPIVRIGAKSAIGHVEPQYKWPKTQASARLMKPGNDAQCKSEVRSNFVHQGSPLLMLAVAQRQSVGQYFGRLRIWRLGV